MPGDEPNTHESARAFLDRLKALAVDDDQLDAALAENRIPHEGPALDSGAPTIERCRSRATLSTGG